MSGGYSRTLQRRRPRARAMQCLEFLLTAGHSLKTVELSQLIGDADTRSVWLSMVTLETHGLVKGWRDGNHTRWRIIDPAKAAQVSGFIETAQAKQKAYEESRRIWRMRHPLITKDQLA